MDFQTKAQKAVTAATSTTPSEALAQSFINDQPKIDSAVKSYMSLCVARSLVASDSDLPPPNSNEDSRNVHQEEHYLGDDFRSTVRKRCIFAKSKNPKQAALLCARELLKAINAPCSIKRSAKVDIQKDDSLLEKEVVRILWDGLLKSGQKPSKCLGRKALSYVSPSVLKSLCETFSTEEHVKAAELKSKGVDLGEVKIFFNEFGHLLFEKEELNIISESDSDTCLLWDTDGGKAELDRRRSRREKSATVNAEGLTSKGELVSANIEEPSDGLTIEELPDDYKVSAQQ